MRRRMLIGLGLIALLLLIVLGYQGIHPLGPELSVSMTKEKYLEGEPIEFLVGVSNRASHDISLFFLYPHSDDMRNLCGFTITRESPGIEQRPSSSDNILLHLPLYPEAVAPSEQWQRKLYLQRFIKQPTPGAYHIPFSLAIGYNEEGHGGISLSWLWGMLGLKTKPGSLQVEGVLSFSIVAATPTDIQLCYERYLALALHENGQAREQACEALFVADSPLVIPYLHRLCDQLPLEREACQKSLDKFTLQYK